MKKTLLVMSALAAVAFVAPANAALLHNYDLNGSLTDSLGGPSLTSFGGTLGPSGYTFGANQGLSLSGLNLTSDGIYDIEISFYFDNLSGWQKIIDFSNRASDSGLYTLGTALNFYPIVTGPDGAFQVGQLATLLLSRDSIGDVTGSVNGGGQFAFGNTPLSISDTLHFFIDDFATGQGEASSGYVDYIRISGTPSVVPLPAALPLLAAGLAGLGFASRRRKTKAA